MSPCVSSYLGMVPHRSASTESNGTVLGAGLGAAKEGRIASIFLQATPDRALRFLTSSTVNRRVASSNLAAVYCEFGQQISKNSFLCSLSRPVGITYGG